MGRSIAFTNGCFDVIHAGHVRCLEFAKAQADVLVVGLNSDNSVRRLKGRNRPINSSESRIAVLSAMTSVDLIVVFSNDTPLEVIKEIRPDVLVKGMDYEGKEIVGAREVESWGGRVVLAPLVPGLSSSDIIERAGLGAAPYAKKE